MANLRDKLRGQPPEKPGKGSKGVAKRAVKPGSRPPVKAAPRASLFGDLDVNRKLLFAALGIAALAGVLAVTYLSDVSDGIMAGGQKVKVYVAVSNLPARKQLDDGMVELRAVPKALLPAGALTDEKDVIGKILLAPVVKGEILHDQRVSDASNATGVAPKLKTNERGFLFVPEGAHDIALVKPDDTVDLTATIQTGNGYLSTKVVQRVRVLSVGNRFSATAPGGEEGNFGDLLTLAVPADKVALLTALKEQGNLSLSLREQGDTTITAPEISLQDLERTVMGHIPRPEPKPAPVRVAPAKTVVIRVPTKVYQPRPATPAPKPGIDVYSGTTLIHKKQP